MECNISRNKVPIILPSPPSPPPPLSSIFVHQRDEHGIILLNINICSEKIKATIEFVHRNDVLFGIVIDRITIFIERTKLKLNSIKDNNIFYPEHHSVMCYLNDHKK